MSAIDENAVLRKYGPDAEKVRTEDQGGEA